MIGIRRKEIKVEEEEAKPAVVLENIPPTDPPEWTDPMRGILIALVEQHRELWDCTLKSSKNRIIERWQEISQLLQNSDKRMTVLSVLEKWCWMVEMHSRSLLSSTWKWRYSGVMSFLNSDPDNSSPYLGCISQERFTILTDLYAVEDCEKLAAETTLPKSKRRSAVQPLFSVELQLYEKIGKRVQTPETEGVVTRASGKLSNSAQSLASANPAPRRGRPRKGSKINTIVSAISKNHEAQKDKDSARVANLELKLATTPKFNIEAVANLLDDVSKTSEVLETVENKREPPDVNVDVPSTSLGSHQVARVDQWTNDLVKALIEEIKQYPALWHSSHPFFRNTLKRREYLSKVTEALHKLPGGSLINEDHVSGKWSLLRESFNKQHKKLKTNGATGWEFYESMAFLTPQVMNACRFDDIGDTEIMVITSPSVSAASPVPNVNTTPSMTVVSAPSATATVTTTNVIDMGESSDVGSYLKRFLNLHPSNEENDAKKPRFETAVPPVAVSTPCSNTKKTNATAASTWVPPKEDSVAAAMQCLISQEYTPKATATAQITSSKSLSSILLEPVKRMTEPENKKKSVSQPPQAQLKVVTPTLTRVKENKRDDKDKWTLMGELVEQTCRELETKSPALAVHLQKEINDTLFKYQLESVGQR